MINFALGILGLLVSFLSTSDHSTVEPNTSPPPSTESMHLIDNLIATVNPCAGNPNVAVCRCALEFPPVTYDQAVTFHLATGPDRTAYDEQTGRTLMNLIRAMVRSIRPDPADGQEIRLYVNPPPTPTPGPALESLVHSNPSFADLTLMKTLFLPRYLGGDADRLFGSIWWHPPSRSLLLCFRGTQTPFEFHLDTLVNAHLNVRPVSPPGSPALKVSRGFGIGYELMREPIARILHDYHDQAEHLFVAGHSLGGAIAAIATADLAGQFPELAITGMTFGQPRVFDPATATTLDTQADPANNTLWRVVCSSDPIPHVPAATTPDAVKFQHTAAHVVYFDDPSRAPGRGAEWNHHFYYDGYFDPKASRAHTVVTPPTNSVETAR